MAATNAAKPRHLEARLDSVTDEQISEAAHLAGKSRSAFVIEAAKSAAERVLARADSTLMPAHDFDQLMTALDVPDPAPGLAARARRAQSDST